ncbi:AAA family ATPase [Rhodovibrio salinarum]|uniref:ATPase n=1 Tax=Rhodovibrio salinarum TaxID=1087 RepID=A0A934QFV7_9PROT|nr:AAA family ATPase [Rhodovibrio salinarum]MBK1696201.1 ATPase [Rhodovibrio salinarum]
MRSDTANRHVILSGCSGGGKSTLLAELQRRGFQTVEEPGRRIVAEEQRGAGKALPWVDLEAFARRAIEMASRDRQHMDGAQAWVFFDRGLVDAAVALEHATGIAASDTLRATDCFHRQVFLTPPWPEIYKTDGARQHGMDDALEEYHRLLKAFDSLGYDTIILPKIDINGRADFVLNCLS